MSIKSDQASSTGEFPILNESQKTTRTENDYQETLITIPPDGGWGWIVVFGAFLSFLVVDGILFSFGIFLYKMSEDLDCSKSYVSMSAAISTGVFCLSGPFAASLVNNYGYRIVGVTGSVLSIISCVLTSISNSIYLIYFTYGVVGGIGFGLIYMPAVIAVGFYFEKWRGIATGIATCGAGLGGVIIPITLTIIQDKVGWRQTFRIIAALITVTAICSMLFRSIAPTRMRRIKLNNMVSGNFFTTYHNRMYPTLSEVTEAPTITLLQPKKLNLSSEVMVMTYPSSSLKCKVKEDEHIPEENMKDSQIWPELNKSNDPSVSQNYVTTLFTSGRKTKKVSLTEAQTFFGASMRPMYRDDIFYNSSFNFLQKYKRTEQISQKSAGTISKSNLEYHMSVTRIATSGDLEKGKCSICTEAVKRTLATMLDYNLLKSPTFLLIASHASFVCLGYFTTYIFIKDRARQTGVPERTTFWLISIIGITNTVGRIGCGFIANWPRIERTWFSAACMIVGGLATILSVHFNETAAHVCYAVIFGGFVACIPALRTLIIVDTLGLEKLTNVIGLTLMFQGAASLIGISIAGVLRDATGDYKWSFYFSGISLIIGALFFVPLKRVAAWEKRRSNRHNHKLNVP